MFRIHSQAKGSTSFDKQFKEDSRVIKKYTRNPFWLLIHAFNRGLTTFVYRLTK